MTPEQFNRSVEALGALIAQELPVINEKVALNAYAMMRDRIINEGTIGDHKDLGKYSDHALPTFFFKDKSLNGKGEKFYLDSVKKGKGISYKDWREANNRPTDHVTLSFSGETLKDIGVVKTVSQNLKATTTVGPKNTKVHKGGKSTEQITDFLVDQYGEILDPSLEEEAKLKGTMTLELSKLIKQVFV